MTNNSSIQLAFVGDMFLGSGEIELSQEVQAILNGADFCVGNLETPITDKERIDSSKVLLRSQPGVEEKLRLWGFNLLSLANNHVFDCGEKGFEETQSRLEAMGVAMIGAGTDFSQATRPYVVERNGIYLGFLAFAWEGTQAIYATIDSAGCAPLQERVALSQIHELKQQVDHVIVLPHWGYCDFSYPTELNVTLGEAMLDIGALMVIGHHSHILQGSRQRADGKYLAYSLGDFVFGQYEHAGHVSKGEGEKSRGAILEITVDQSSIVAIQWHFTRNVQGRIQLENTSQREKQFQKRSQPFLNIEGYSVFWKRQVKKWVLKRLLFWANPLNWRRIKLATFQSIWIMLKEILVGNKGTQ